MSSPISTGLSKTSMCMKFASFLYRSLTADRINTCGPHVAVEQNAGLAKVMTVGFSLSMADATVVVRWHYKLLRRLRRVVDRHGGLLESYEDDRFMGFFGVPRAGEHDLERAVACAEGIQMLTQQGSIRRRRIAISIGVHRGEISMGGQSGRSIRYLGRGDVDYTVEAFSKVAAAA